MQSIQYRLVELFLIFIIIPISFVIEFPLWIKMSVGVLGFGYIVFVLLKVENNKFKIAKYLNWKQFWKQTVFKLLGIAIITSLYMYFVDCNNLYIVIRTKPLLWVTILCVYSVFSVYPQELIYRTFFFQRYKALFKNETLFMLLNAALFSLAHLFFRNTLVTVLTFVGGILFALTFMKTKSTLLVSIEHAIYGCWLFTVGMGSMLGFPS